MSTTNTAQPPHVSNVLMFEVGGYLEKFLEIGRRANAINEKLDSPGKARVWTNYFGAAQGGRTAIVVIEYPSLVAMAQFMARQDTSADWLKLRAEAEASGIKLLSNSVVTELIP